MKTLFQALVLATALAACGNGGADDTDTGAGTTDTDPGTTPAACDLSCTDYCTTFLANCATDPSNTYTDQADCEAVCAGFECGTSADVTGDTLGCRIYHAGAAASDPAVHCPHAGETPTDQCI